MRILALDLGDKRIGMALSDPSGSLATPCGAIERKTPAADYALILEVARENEVEEILIGLPRSLKGGLGHQAQKVERFAEGLRSLTTLPVVLLDERFSTIAAERSLRESGSGRRRDKGRIDAAAAALLLQQYLDSRGRRPPG